MPMTSSGSFPLLSLPGQLRVDTRYWPLVTLTVEGRVDDAALEEHLREIENEVLIRGENFVQLIDQRNAEPLNATQRAIVAQHQTLMEDVYRAYCKAEAYVCNAEMKGVMIAIFWQAKPAYSYRFFEDIDVARRWLREQLAEYLQTSARP